MKCTQEELIFYSSVISKENLFGIDLKINEEESREDLVASTLNELRKKGILDDNNRLSIAAIQILRAISDYKKASFHVILNRLRIALVNEANAVVIYQSNQREYELLRIPKLAIALLVMKQYPFLQEKACEVFGEEVTMSKAALLRLMQGEREGNLIIREYKNRISDKDMLYKQQDKDCKQYNLKTGKVKPISPSEIRKALLKSLQVKEELECRQN